MLVAGWARPRLSTLIVAGLGASGLLALWFWTQSLLAPLPPTLVAAAAASELAQAAGAPPPALSPTPGNATPAGPADQAAAPVIWVMDPARSELQFAGTHIGRPFSGTFGTFTADIAFSPGALATSRAAIVVDLASARIGNREYDSALPGTDWLDSARVAQALFATTRFTATGPMAFVAEGRLTLRGVTRDVRLPFSLRFAGDEVVMEGTTVLNRLDFAIGAKNDAAAEWVSREITLTIRLTARKAG